MSTITDIFSSNSARDTSKPAASNTGLCIFRSDTNAIEVSDGTSYQTYNSDGVIVHSFPTNTKALDFLTKRDAFYSRNEDRSLHPKSTGRKHCFHKKISHRIIIPHEKNRKHT